jgi:mutator family transposase
MRAKGESQNAWEGLLNDLQDRGLTGANLKLVVTDGCAGLAAAIETVYPRVRESKNSAAAVELGSVHGGGSDGPSFFAQ